MAEVDGGHASSRHAPDPRADLAKQLDRLLDCSCLAANRIAKRAQVSEGKLSEWRNNRHFPGDREQWLKVVRVALENPLDERFLQSLSEHGRTRYIKHEIAEWTGRYEYARRAPRADRQAAVAAAEAAAERAWQPLSYPDVLADLQQARAEGLAPRRQLMSAVDAFTAAESAAMEPGPAGTMGEPGRYLLIEAVAGMGKTTFAADLADRRGWIHHYTGGHAARTDTARVVDSLIWQLLRRFPLLQEPSAKERGRPETLETVLAKAGQMAALQDGEPLVVVVDGLDAGLDTDGPPSLQSPDRATSAEEGSPGVPMKPAGLPLGLPGRPPANVCIIITARPGVLAPIGDGHEPVIMDPGSPDHLQEITGHVRAFVERMELCGQLTEHYEGLDDHVVAVIGERTQGLWVYLHHLLQDLSEAHARWSQDPATRLEQLRAFLHQIPAGLGAYYTRQLQRLDAHPAGQRERARTLLSILACAFTPLPQRVLTALAAPITSEQITALVMAAGGLLRRHPATTENDRQAEQEQPGEHGSIGLFHASFADFLLGRFPQQPGQHPLGRPAAPDAYHVQGDDLAARAALTHRHIADHYLNAWGGWENGLPDAASSGGLGHEDEWYGRWHLCGHLEQAGDHHMIHQLLALQTTNEDDLEGGQCRNLWFEAARTSGLMIGFVHDVQRAQRLAAATTDNELSHGGRSAAIGLECRYALMLASLESHARDLSASLIEAALKQQVWGSREAFFAALDSNDVRVQILVAEQIGKHLTAARRQGRLPKDEADFGGRLLADLTSLGRRWLDYAPEGYTAARLALAQGCCTTQEQQEIVREILDGAAVEFRGADHRAALELAAELLEADELQHLADRLLGRADRIALNCMTPLVPYLSAVQLTRLCDRITQYNDHLSAGSADPVTGEVPEAPATVLALDRALELAVAAASGPDHVERLLLDAAPGWRDHWRTAPIPWTFLDAEVLLQQLPHDRRMRCLEALLPAITAVVASGNMEGKNPLGLLAHLSREQRQHLTSTARKHANKSVRAFMLAALADSDHSGLAQEALDTLPLHGTLRAKLNREISGDRAGALARLAPVTPPAALPRLIEHIQALPDPATRARLLLSCHAAHPHGDFGRQALALLGALPSDQRDNFLRWSAHLLAAAGYADQVMHWIAAIDDAEHRRECLARLAPHLSKPVLHQQLSRRQPIADTAPTALATAALGSRLDPQTASAALDAASATAAHLASPQDRAQTLIDIASAIPNHRHSEIRSQILRRAATLTLTDDPTAQKLLPGQLRLLLPVITDAEAKTIFRAARADTADRSALQVWREFADADDPRWPQEAERILIHSPRLIEPYRGVALALIGPSLIAPRDIRRALEEADRMDPLYPGDQVLATAGVAAALDPAQRTRLLDAFIDCLDHRENNRPDSRSLGLDLDLFCEQLVPHLDEHSRSRLLDHVLPRAGLDTLKVLRRLVPADLHDRIDARYQELDLTLNQRILMAAAAHGPELLRQRILDTAPADNPVDRGNFLAVALTHQPPAEAVWAPCQVSMPAPGGPRQRIFGPVRKALTVPDRPAQLIALAGAAAHIEHHGGPKAIRACLVAIDDVRRWWPGGPPAVRAHMNPGPQ